MQVWMCLKFMWVVFLYEKKNPSFGTIGSKCWNKRAIYIEKNIATTANRYKFKLNAQWAELCIFKMVGYSCGCIVHALNVM